MFVGWFFFWIKCLCMEWNWCYYFIDLQQKAIFSKNWGGPEKDRFLGVFFVFLFFLFFSKVFFGISTLSSLLSSFFSLYLSPSSSSSFSMVVLRPLPGLRMETRRDDLRAVLAVFCSWSSSQGVFCSWGSSDWQGLPRPLALPMPHNNTPSPTPLLPRRLLWITLVTCCLLTGIILLRLGARGSSPWGSPARHKGQPELYWLRMYPQIHAIPRYMRSNREHLSIEGNVWRGADSPGDIVGTGISQRLLESSPPRREGRKPHGYRYHKLAEACWKWVPPPHRDPGTPVPTYHHQNCIPSGSRLESWQC